MYCEIYVALLFFCFSTYAHSGVGLEGCAFFGVFACYPNGAGRCDVCILDLQIATGIVLYYYLDTSIIYIRHMCIF